MREMSIMRIGARHIARIETTGILGDLIALVVFYVWIYVAYLRD